MNYILMSIFSRDGLNKILDIAGKYIEEEKIYNFISDFIKVILIFLVMYITIKIGNMIINRYIKKQKNFKISLNDRKAKTIGAVLKSILKYCVYFFGIFGIISVISPKVGMTGLTFAGIGGVALGLGAQNLIKDIINGFFILFEDQFSVGDYISIDDKSGIVQSLELRVTKIRDLNGDLHIIPNGLITKITNHSRGDTKFYIDFDIAYDEDSKEILSIVSDICKKFSEENEFITDGPDVLGIIEFKDNAVTIGISGKAKAMKQFDIEVKLREKIIDELKRKDVKMPCRQVKIIKGD